MALSTRVEPGEPQVMISCDPPVVSTTYTGLTKYDKAEPADLQQLLAMRCTQC